MSILNNKQPIQPNDIEFKIQILKTSPKQAYDILFNTWSKCMKAVWSNPEQTAEILQALGTDAAELFTLSTITAQYLETIKPNSTTELLALVKEVAINEDGTATLV